MLVILIQAYFTLRKKIVGNIFFISSFADVPPTPLPGLYFMIQFFKSLQNSWKDSVLALQNLQNQNIILQLTWIALSAKTAAAFTVFRVASNITFLAELNFRKESGHISLALSPAHPSFLLCSLFLPRQKAERHSWSRVWVYLSRDETTWVLWPTIFRPFTHTLFIN